MSVEVATALRRTYELECRIETVLETWDAMGTDWPLLYEHARAQVMTEMAAAGEEIGDADGRGVLGQAL